MVDDERNVRLLHLEDDPRDAALIRDKLEAGGLRCEIVHVQNEEAFAAALAGPPFDLILTDFDLGSYDGLSALKLANERQPYTPVILVSGTLGEEEAVRSLLVGAKDYLLKARMERLIPAIRRALKEAEDLQRRREAEAELRESEERHRMLFQSNPVPMWVYDTQTLRFVAVNQAAISSYGYAEGEFLAMTIRDLRPPEDLPALEHALQSRESGTPTLRTWRHRTKNGEVIDVEITSEAIVFGGRKGRLVLASNVTERRKAQDALRDSEALLRIAGRAAQMGGWSIDHSDMRVTWSEEVRAIHEVPPGVTPSVEETILFYAPEWRETVANAVSACLRDGTPFDEELELLTAKGRRIWVRTIGQPVRADDGTVRRIHGAFQDITARKRAAEATRALAERLTTTLESITDAFFTLDDDWRFTYLNGESERILHHSRAELLGTVVWESFPELTGSAFERQYRRAAAEHRTVAFEEFYPSLGIWLEVRVYPSSDGLTVYFRDVTGRRLADQKLRHQEEQYRAIVEAVTNAILILDFSGRIVTANKAACDMAGYSLDELIGGSGFDLVRGSDRGKLEMLASRARAGEPSYAEAVQVRRDQRELDVVIHSAAFQMGGVPHLLLVISNVSEQKRLQQQLERTERISSLGRMAANIAHEMNNVMMGILPFTEIIKRRAVGDSMLENAASRIIKAVGRGKVVTQEILRFTRAAEAPQLESLAAPQFLAEVADEMRPALNKAISLEVWCEEGLYILGDAAQLQQVITNLVKNARDAMPGGGRISLRLETSSPAAITHFAGTADPEAYAYLQVSDSGRGIPPHVIPHIFEPLFTTKESEGTGLGLAIVQQIVTLHGGHIRVESHPERGTTFHILLRKASPADEVPAQKGDDSAAVWKYVQSIVLVDDQAAVAEGMIALLSLEGVTCEWFPSGRLAIQRLRAFRPDLLILDVGLPDMSGIEVYREVMRFQPNLLTIFSTGHGDHRMLGDLTATPSVGFLSKPYNFVSLAQRVAQLRSAGESPSSRPAHTDRDME